MGRACVLALCLAIAQDRDDEALVRQAVERFFEAIGAKKVEAAAALWAAKSPQRDAFAKEAPAVAEYLAAKPLSGLKVLATAIDGDRAAVTIGFRGHWVKDDEQFPDEPVTYWRVELRKEEGAWRWWAQEHAAIALARAVAGLEGDAERLQLLKADPALATWRLAIALVDEAGARIRATDLKGAARRYESAIAAARLSRNRNLEAFALFSATRLYFTAGRPREAIAILLDALKLAIEAGDHRIEAAIRNALGEAYLEIDRLDVALEQLTKSLEIAYMGGFADVIVLARANIGAYHRDRGHDWEAFQYFTSALDLARKIGRKDLQPAPLNNIGWLLKEHGDYGGALVKLTEALKLATELPDLPLAATVLNNIGCLHLALGENLDAINRLRESLDLAEKTFNAGTQGQAWVNLGEAYRREGHPDDAITCYQNCLTLAGENPRLALMARNNLACARLAKKDATGAQSDLEASLALADRLKLDRAKIMPLNNLGWLACEGGDPKTGIDKFKAALEIAVRHGSEEEVSCHRGIGWAHARLGDHESAAGAYRDAIACLEWVRSRMQDPAMRQSFMADNTSLYFLLAESLRELKRDGQAFDAAERSKARTLAEMMDRGPAAMVKAMTETEKIKERELQATLTALQRKLDEEWASDTREAIAAAIRKSRGALEDFRRELFVTHPDLALLRGRFDPPSPADLQRRLFAREPGLRVVSYIVGRRSGLIFVLAPGKDEATLTVHPLEMASDVLEGRVRALGTACAVSTSAYADLAKELHRALIASAKDALAGATHIAFVPDFLLHSLPFQVLMDDGGTHLIERCSVSTAPSLAALLRMTELAEARRKTEDPKRPAMFAMGAPVKLDGTGVLKGAAREVEQVAEGFSVTAHTGAEASETRAREEMGSARRIHLATHAEADETSPMYSRVLLSADARHDGFLYAHEIADLELGAELVVLSACHTARGRVVTGEGTVGLTWALLAAGAPSCVVTQWQAADEGTAALMATFYASLRKGSGAGEALREAQRAAMKDARFAHPYYWAPFVLVGDWRK